MLAGISGATPGSGAGSGLDDSDGRLKLLHAPSNNVSAEAVASLTNVCALPVPIIPHSPEHFPAAPVLQPSVKR
jgi:hypothetical protein